MFKSNLANYLLIFFLLIFINKAYSVPISDEAYPMSTSEKIRILQQYINKVNKIRESDIQRTVNMSYICYMEGLHQIEKIKKFILASAKERQRNLFFIPLKNKYSFCPNIKIEVSNSLILLEGEFKKDLITINYNYTENCKEETNIFSVKYRVCNEKSIETTLAHEFVHFTFCKLYGNCKFRDIFYREVNRCKTKRCKYFHLLKNLREKRLYIDEFPATYYSSLVPKIEKCNIFPKEDIFRFPEYYKISFILGMQRYLTCRRSKKCTFFEVYKYGENAGKEFNGCIYTKLALRNIIKITLEKERENFIPEVRKLIKILKRRKGRK